MECMLQLFRKKSRNTIIREFHDNIDILKNKLELLNIMEKDARLMLERAERARMAPKTQVLGWLRDVRKVNTATEQMETLVCGSSIGDSALKDSDLVIEFIIKVDHLEERKQSLDIMVEQEQEQEQKQQEQDQKQELSPDREELLIATEIVGESVYRTSNVILEYLMDPVIGIIGVYGIGGVGKTTTMLNINSHLSIDDSFDIIIWVTVSKVFNLDDLQNEIARGLRYDLPIYRNEMGRAAVLLEMLKKVKFLIIFDDVWEFISLEKIGVPWPNIENGCKIVLTTRSLEVCQCMSTDENVYVGRLPDKEAWNLFVNKAGDQVLDPAIRPFAREVVAQCISHPLVIMTIAQTLRECKSVMLWKDTLRSLRSLKQDIRDPYMVIHQLLGFSYSRLKSITSQKCFLYCAFFPEDHLFEPNELIRYWIAENFIKWVGGMVAQIDEGFKILKELKSVGMLQVFKKHLRMHTMFRDLAIDIMSQEPGIFFHSGLGLKVLQNDWEWAQARKISLMRNRINFLDDIPYSCPALLTLLLKDNTLLYDISPTFFNVMPSLEVLDISYSGIVELPSSLSHLVNLRALFLQNCRSLNKISTVKNLKKLQFLNLRGTSIKELPHGIEELVNLRFLDLSETTSLVRIKEGKMSSLCCLEELQLRGSSIGTVNNSVILINELRSLKLLSTLTLTIVGFGEHLDTIMYLQGQSIKSFSIDVYGSAEDIVDHMEDV